MGNYEGAGRDLDEATRIAVRSGFRLHEADARARMGTAAAGRRGSQESARASLDVAAEIIEETGYHRRDAAVAAVGGGVGGCRQRMRNE